MRYVKVGWLDIDKACKQYLYLLGFSKRLRRRASKQSGASTEGTRRPCSPHCRRWLAPSPGDWATGSGPEPARRPLTRGLSDGTSGVEIRSRARSVRVEVQAKTYTSARDQAAVLATRTPLSEALVGGPANIASGYRGHLVAVAYRRHSRSVFTSVWRTGALIPTSTATRKGASLMISRMNLALAVQWRRYDRAANTANTIISVTAAVTHTTPAHRHSRLAH